MKNKMVRFTLLLDLVLAAPLLPALGVREGKVYTVPSGASATPVPIVPAQSVGPVSLSMSKQDVIKILGRPESIFFGDARFSLRDSPARAWYVFPRAGLSILFEWENISAIAVLSENYAFPGGVRVGMNVAAAEAVLGKMPEESGIGNPDGSVTSAHEVYYTASGTYRMADYQQRSIAFRVDLKTGVLTQLWVSTRSNRDTVSRYGTSEPSPAAESKALRTYDARRLAGNGLDLNKYTLVLYRYSLQHDQNIDLYHGQVFEGYYYVLLSSTRGEIDQRAQSFLTTMDSIGRQGPTITEVVSRYGLPSVVGVSFNGDYQVDSLWYRSLLLTINADHRTLREVTVWPQDGSYRFRGKLGYGSTMDEVFAEMGKPVQTAPEGLAGVGPDRVLFLGPGGKAEDGSIKYVDSRIKFAFSNGKVYLITRYWD